MAPTNITKRPAQHKQSSRKGKKAWRKNIDLTDLESTLEESKDNQIKYGADDIAAVQDDSLFQVDNDGDRALRERLIKRKQIKKNLKSTEILDAIKTNSKVGALTHHKHRKGHSEELPGGDAHHGKGKKVQGVSKREMLKLLALAGRITGESKLENRVAKDGLIKSSSFDLWGDDKSTQIQLSSGIKIDKSKTEKASKELLTMSTTSWSIATKTPKTLKEKPVTIKEFEQTPHAGKSYNPQKRDWSELFEKEYNLEKVREDNRIALEEYRERIRHLMETLDDNEEADSSSSESESEAEAEDDEEGSVDMGLSVNEAIQIKKKTKYQRNRARKHEEKVKLHKELKELKQQFKELENLEEIVESIAVTKSEGTKPKRRKANNNKLGTRYGIMEEKLEIKFQDELGDSLRKLRPEGNLLYENVRKLQSSGKIESRIPTRQRRAKNKITEKWTHKDFK
ncbi:Nop53p KNAG_0J01620 [Huiozyma naganishii CBS 8797]|uniref:Ribosome biogenesis protein NOP53 n=1 Tax=Huiozyma naganishii (strain ATCC MYA-139 / BCRC 22969 / CBS 8797 / KCTC 17520 / NBRC 10181 / NCYC 3082 / Yp74L-3) TaxID=1071383 RepID=J7RQY8_HUIN7|nr:hypothetical protein KNAG_0J01620 [Kazachstania naganishii CBS 8797]CCK72243.1 hypothetical protein KNAG_0J01620 [Kazachstania naganishii CBS 8797]